MIERPSKHYSVATLRDTAFPSPFMGPLPRGNIESEVLVMRHRIALSSEGFLRCLETIAHRSGDFEAGEVALALDNRFSLLPGQDQAFFLLLHWHWHWHWHCTGTALAPHLMRDCSLSLSRYVLPKRQVFVKTRRRIHVTHARTSTRFRSRGLSSQYLRSAGRGKPFVSHPGWLM